MLEDLFRLVSNIILGVNPTNAHKATLKTSLVL